MTRASMVVGVHRRARGRAEGIVGDGEGRGRGTRQWTGGASMPGYSQQWTRVGRAGVEFFLLDAYNILGFEEACVLRGRRQLEVRLITSQS